MSRSPRYDLDPALEDEPFGIEVVEELVRGEARSLVESEKATVHFLKRVFATLTDSTHQMRTLEADVRRKRLSEVRDAAGPGTPQEYFEAARALTPQQLHTLYERSFRDRVTEIENACAEINSLRVRLRPEILGAQTVLDQVLSHPELSPPARERLARARARVPADPGAEALDPRQVLAKLAPPAASAPPPAAGGTAQAPQQAPPAPQAAGLLDALEDLGAPVQPAPPAAGLLDALEDLGAPPPISVVPSLLDALGDLEPAAARDEPASEAEEELPELPELPGSLRDLF